MSIAPYKFQEREIESNYFVLSSAQVYYNRYTRANASLQNNNEKRKKDRNRRKKKLKEKKCYLYTSSDAFRDRFLPFILYIYTYIHIYKYHTFIVIAKYMRYCKQDNASKRYSRGAEFLQFFGTRFCTSILQCI